MDYPLEYLIDIARNFTLRGDIVHIERYGSGRINNTFLVTLESGKDEKVILQRINERVFVRPDWTMFNIRTVLDHIQERLKHEQYTDSNRRWEMPCLFPSKDGRDYFIDIRNSYWRCLSFINSSNEQGIKDSGHAKEIGYGLGKFHALISDLDNKRLYDTLEGFHITPHYLRLFDEIIKTAEITEKSPKETYCLKFINQRRNWVSVLEDAKDRLQLIIRPIHGDPKFSNIMLNKETGHAFSIIDLDTVKPGLVHYDIGDCLRSCCNSAGEETDKYGDVHFRTDYCKAVLEGYFSEARNFLNETDYLYLYDSIRLIAFELGLRFFMDYLAGNVYFKVKHDEDNLTRALVQFKLTDSIESQESEIKAIIADLS